MRLSLLAAAIAIAVAPVPAACQQIPDPTVAWVAGQTDLPFHLYQGNRVVAPGTINGRAVEMLLDSGAGVTAIDTAYARSIGIGEGQKVPARGSGGMSEAELVSGVTLTIGGLKLTNVTAAVIDLSSIAKALGRPMNVVLGRELFDHAVIAIDWEKGRLAITDPATFKPATTSRTIALANDGTFNFTDIGVAGLPPVRAVLDLGNGGALSLPHDYWSKQPALAGLRHADTIAGGVGGQHASRAVTLPTVDFAGSRFTAVPATLHGPAPEGAVTHPNIGIGMLKPFKVVMDLGRDRLYLEPRANPPAFVRDRSGLRTMLGDGALTVRHVSPQGPAAAAGLKEGDRIVSVGTIKVDADFGKSVVSDWARGPAGTTVKLGLADGRSIDLTLADYF